MGKLNIFEISFNNTSDTFYSGDLIEGRVTVELKESMKIRGIQITFEGQAYVDWTETDSSGIYENSNSNTRTRRYTSRDNYFNENVLLFGISSSQGSSTQQLQRGMHTFPFRFQLPHGIPSSFEGDIGHVRYSASCKIDKPWTFDHQTKRVFTVIRVLDLNSQAAYSQRCSGNSQKHLCCLCCKSGPISAQFSIDRQGWVPGETIRLYADIRNDSERTMEKSYVILKMKTTFYGGKSKNINIKEIARVNRPSIRAHREDFWIGEQIEIPPLTPSFLEGCKIIDIEYILQHNQALACAFQVPSTSKRNIICTPQHSELSAPSVRVLSKLGSHRHCHATTHGLVIDYLMAFKKCLDAILKGLGL